MKYISRPRSSIGQSDGLLIRRLCVRFAPRTQFDLWWLWCNSSTTSCGDVCTGANPVSHPFDDNYILVQNIIKHMAKKTGYDIRHEERLTRPPRMEGKAKNVQTKNIKKKKKA